MNAVQENILIELIKEYFKGGNAQNSASGPVLKNYLEGIRDFVEENISK